MSSWMVNRTASCPSLSSLVREALDAYLKRLARPATGVAEVAGIGEDPETRGRDHDDALYRPRR